MKKLIVLLLCFGLCGCTAATAISSNRKNLIKSDWPKDTLQEFREGIIKIGMNKEQVFFLLGAPQYWTKHELQEGIFESWFWAAPEQTKVMWVTTCDFKNGILTGYSGGVSSRLSTKGCYYSKDKIEDVRDFKK